MESPTDSGLDGVNTDPTTESERPKTGSSDTMEDLSLQDDVCTTEIPLDAPPAIAEINLNDEEREDDLFKSARLEPEMSKFTNGHDSSRGGDDLVTDIPLEDDEEPYNNPHLQLSTPGTLTSFQDMSERTELEGGDEYIEITVTSPHKVGDGMGSFMAYKVKTVTNLSFFKKKESQVTRRFSDFLGLRDKL